jgi:hypothetical protein
MWKRIAVCTAVAGALALVLYPRESSGQPGRGRGGPGGGGGGLDPGAIFDRLANGRQAIAASEAKMVSAKLSEWAQKNGARDTEITREQFVTFFNEVIRPSMGGGMRPGGAPGMGGPFPGMGRPGFGPGQGPGMRPGTPGGQQVPTESPLDRVKRRAEMEFRDRDDNGDGSLNTDEMPDGLRDALSQWDKDQDNQVNLAEFTAFTVAEFEAVFGRLSDVKGEASSAVIDELDRRPTVYRAGKLPKELPPWFKQFDTDTDGQVALHEWRAAKQPLERFAEMDRNDDGFLMVEEVLRLQSVANGGNGGNGNQTASMGMRPGFGPGGMGMGRGMGPGGMGMGRGMGPGGSPGMGMGRGMGMGGMGKGMGKGMGRGGGGR